MDYGILFQGNTSPFGLKPGAAVDGIDVGPNAGVQYLQTPALAAGVAPAQAPQGILDKLAANPDVYDAMIQAGTGLLSAGNLRDGLAKGFAGFQQGLTDAQARRLASRKLTLEELKANKPSVTPAGVPGHVLLTYPDGRTETVVNDAAVQAYEAQQDRLDQRQQRNLDAQQARFEAQQAAADRRQSNMFGQQLKMLNAKTDAKTDAANTQKQADAMDSVELLNEAGTLLDQSTSSWLGNVVDKGAGVFGASTPGSQAAARLKVLGGYLTSKVPKMSGPQSDKDVAQYKEMAGKLGDPTIPYADKKAALDTMLGLQRKYAGQTDSITPPSRSGENADPLGLRK